MTLGAFLRDRGVVVVLGVVCVLCVGLALGVLGAGIEAALLLSFFVAACFTAALIWEFLREKRFYDELTTMVEGLQQSYYVTSLIEEPSFLEGRLAHQALADAGKAAADEVALPRAQAAAYREYIELWIHEIKTPIAAAHLMAANLHGPEASKLKGELDRIEAQVEQALYYARSTSLERDYAIREVSLVTCINDTLKRNARYLIERGVMPDVQVGEDQAVFADEKWLSFVIGQVVVNAAKYGARSVRFSVMDTPAGETAQSIVLEIADDGCGIPEADVPRVFDRGFTGTNGRAQGSSTGMGLYLVTQMCEKMGLGVGLASEQGTGTRVLITFPQDRRRLNLSKA